MAADSIDALVQQITTSNSLDALAHTLRTFPSTSSSSARDLNVREMILASALASGQDPLTVLHLRNNALGVLWILSARLTMINTTNTGLQRPPWGLVVEFCQGLERESVRMQVRMAPERVVLLARALGKYAPNLKQAIPSLYTLATRLPPTPSTLTPIHPILLFITLQSNHITPHITNLLLEHPIDDLFAPLLPNAPHTSLPDCLLTTTDNTTYHYLAGVILALTENYSSSMDYLEAALSAPTGPPSSGNSGGGSSSAAAYGASGAMGGGLPAAIQLEALKKLKLIQCIALGAPQTLPKYTHPVLTKLWKSSAYAGLVNAYTAFPSSSGKVSEAREGRESRKERGGERSMAGMSTTSASGSTSVAPGDAASLPFYTLVPGTKLQSLIDRDHALFAAEGNLGLVLRLARAAPGWAVKRLTETYVTLGLKEVGKMTGTISTSSEGTEEDEAKVRALVLKLIENKTINGTISASGIVTFHDAPATGGVSDEDLRILLSSIPSSIPPSQTSALYSSLSSKSGPGSANTAALPALLAAIQAQSAHLASLDTELARNREFIKRAAKINGLGGSGGGGGGMPGMGAGIGAFGLSSGEGMDGDDEDVYGPGAPGYSYGEDSIMYS